MARLSAFEDAIGISLDADAERRRVQREALVCYENRVIRYGYGRASGAQLGGPKGDLILKEVQTRFSHDPKDANGNPVIHTQYCTLLDLRVDLQHRIGEERGLIYNSALQIRGELQKSDQWLALRDSSSYDVAMVKKLIYCSVLGSCVVRPKLHPMRTRKGRPVKYYPPGLDVVMPHLCTVIPMPNDSMRPMVYIEYRDGDSSIEVVDMSAPDFPRWEGWKSVNQWRASWDLDPEDNKRLKFAGREWFRNGDNPSGEVFPWTYDGKAIMPITAYQDQSRRTEIQPYDSTIVADTIDMILEATRIRMKSYHMGHPTPLFTGTGQLTISPLSSTSMGGAVLVNCQSGETINVDTIQSARQEIIDDEKRIKDRYEEILNRHAPGLQVQRQAAESAAALVVREGGLYRYRNDQIEAHRPGDEHSTKALISTYNYQVAAGLTDGEFIPEVEPDIYYPLSWTPAQKAQAMAEAKEALNMGVISRVDYYLVRTDLEDTPENRQIAVDALIRVGQEEQQIAQGGNPQRAANGAVITPAPIPIPVPSDAPVAGDVPIEPVIDTGPASYITPPEMKANAGQGRELYRQHKDRFVATPTRYRERALAIIDDELRTRDLFELSSYYNAHSDDATKAYETGAWGDASDPCSAWIEWQMNGGDSGREWVGNVLLTLQPVATEETADATE